MNDNISNLKQGSSLQGGKYVIEKTLGQGGFGITYMGLQVGLNRRVAIKEFFMKEYCERDSGTSHVTVGSQGSRDIVDRFRMKFVKEAQTIAQLDNPHVIRIYDIFEENGTAYYVMEYIEGGSLEQYVKERQRLDESSAVKFVGQIADALTYIHGKNILHLDIKPSNVLLRDNGDAVLIDFGISKHYDEQGGQTSTTPAGISKGYAPFEQYTQEGISHFEPSTDVYSLGAVLYKLLTGERPAEASVLISEGLTIPSYISSRCSAVISKAMSSKKSERYQSVVEMKAALKAETSFNNNDDETEVEILNTENKFKEKVHENETGESEKDRKFRKYAIGAIGLVVLLVVGFLFVIMPDDNTSAPSPKEDIPGKLIRIPDKLITDSIINDIKPEQPKVNPTLTLSCKTSGASLYVDGKKKGTGKWSGELSAGKHKVEARLDGYQTATKTLEMSDGDTYSHTFPELTAISNTSVETNPTLTLSCKTSEAVLYVDGEKKGTGKWSGELSAGTHKVEAKLDGFKTETETFSLANGGTYSHTFPALTVIEKKLELVTTTANNNTSLSSSSGTINGHEYVDLGLSVKWATCNVGASSPTGYGNYYAWGEITTKSEYTRKNSRTYGKDIIGFGGNPKYDVARANWGSSWRLPTKAEFQELLDNCNGEWTTVSGVKGRKLTSKKNGKSIFLPAAGRRNGSSLDYEAVGGRYWGSTDDYYKSNGDDLWLSDLSQIVYHDDRSYGQSVRPVSD